MLISQEAQNANAVFFASVFTLPSDDGTFTLAPGTPVITSTVDKSCRPFVNRARPLTVALDLRKRGPMPKNRRNETPISIAVQTPGCSSHFHRLCFWSSSKS